MNIGQMIQAKGMQIRGVSALQGAKLSDINSILKAKTRRPVVVHTTKPLAPIPIPQATSNTITKSSLFADEMRRLKVLKNQYPTLTEDELLQLARPFKALRAHTNYDTITTSAK